MRFDTLMRRMSIRFRMWGTTGVVAISLILVGGIGIAAQLYANGIADHLVKRDVASLTEIARMQQAMSNLRLSEKNMIIEYENTVEVARHKDLWTAAMAQIEKSGAALAPLLVQDSQRAQLSQAMEALHQFSQEFAPMAKQLENLTFPSAQVASATIGKLQPLFSNAETPLTNLSTDLQNTTQASQQTLQNSASRVVWLIGGITLLIVLIITPLTVLNTNSICSPMVQAEKMAQAIAQGDLTAQHVDTAGNDEVARLLRSLVAMQGALAGLVGQVRQATESLSTASAEIAAGNQDLSMRTEQTSSNLQHTASSMDQLTATVQQSATASHQANQLAASAGEVAARGGQVVAQVVSTMSDIQVSSKKINDIISVIDGIAFQTNILALNAAVEAARAGEQGRGFAVVASEVRSLAGRSAEAAKEIKTLISASVQRIDVGTKLVTDAGQTMNDIVASVQRVTDMMGEISAAASEQNHGITEVNGAISALDQMTQQNAALVEQSAATAQSMREQAQRLTVLVDTFKLLSDGDRAVPRLGGRTVLPKLTA